MPLQIAGLIHLELLTDFFNKIGHKPTLIQSRYAAQVLPSARAIVLDNRPFPEPRCVVNDVFSVS